MQSHAREDTPPANPTSTPSWWRECVAPIRMLALLFDPAHRLPEFAREE
jgi:hypothetical protein